MASSIFGGLAEAGLGLFGKKGKTQKNFLSDDLLKQTNLTTNALPEYRAGQKGDLDRILAQIAGAQPQIAQVGQDDLSSLGQLVNQLKNTTSLDTGMQYGNYATGLLDKVARNIAGFGKAEDNRLLASLGHGGGGGSTFQTNTILDRVSKNLSPAYASVINSIPGAVNSFAAGDTSRVGNVANLVNQRAGIPLRGAQAEFLGSQVRTQNLMDEIAALTGLGGAQRVNYLGSEYIPTRGEQVASGLGTAFDSAVDTGLSAYSGGLLGGQPADKQQQLMDIIAKYYSGGGSGGRALTGGFNPMSPGYNPNQPA